MKIYIAKWPDNSISILSAKNQRDLFFKLDCEGDPAYAEIKEYNFNKTDDIYFTSISGNNIDCYCSEYTSKPPTVKAVILWLTFY